MVPRITTISAFRKPATIGHKKNKSLVISAPGQELWFLLFLMLGNNSNKTKQTLLEMRGWLVGLFLSENKLGFLESL